MPQPTAAPGTINGDMVDRFTLAHAGVGAVYGLLGFGWAPVVALAIGWELLERPLKNALPGAFPHATQDTAANALMDAAAVITAWWVVRRVRR